TRTMVGLPDCAATGVANAIPSKVSPAMVVFISNSSSRIVIAYAMEWISKPQMDDLNSIRHVRNVFAHSEKAHTFEKGSITKECRAFGQHLSKMFKDSGFEEKSEGRELYMATCLGLGLSLVRATNVVLKQLTLVRAIENCRLQ